MTTELDASRVAQARAAGMDAFTALAAPLRRELQAHCYRMVGSLHDAEDLVQDTFLRAWRGSGAFEGRASLRTWLYRIATNASLDLLDKRGARSVPQGSRPPADPHAPPEAPTGEALWLEPYPDDALGEPEPGPEARYSQKQSIALAFVAALQVLAPRQRAVLVLRDVLGWPAAEVAEALEMTVAGVNSALQRAHATLEAHGVGPETAAPVEDADLRDLLHRYVRAWEDGDVNALVSLMREDVILSMPPTPSWFRGRADVSAMIASVLAGDARGRFRVIELRANGAAAFAFFQKDPATQAFKALGIQVVDADAAGVREITAFLAPSLFPRFGQPEEIRDRP